MITDDMIHGAWAGARRVRRIEAETAVLPHVIAACVVEEASAWLHEPLPETWVRELTAKADLVFTHNVRFRRRLTARGNLGRDRLWAFMRHWLAAMLYDRRPDCLARLPQSYRVGTAPGTR
jgi:hypothetical protein